MLLCALPISCKHVLSMIRSRIFLISDTGEIRRYIKAMRELDISKIKDKREADGYLTPCIPVRVYNVYLWSNN